MKKRRRVQALALGTAMALGVTSIACLYERHEQEVQAEDLATKLVDKVVFSEGEGLKADFSEDSWEFYADAKNGAMKTEYYPTIVNDGKEGQYLGTGDNKVIRLIRGVKEGSVPGQEAEDSYQDYRTGAAFLGEGIALSQDAAFSMAFTFSMPEAVVNSKQTNGAEFSREVGGDGIALVMTTQKGQTVQAGSGIGYQGIKDSLAIELDSYFNGAYCDMDADTYAYTNWGFDNQLYFHRGSTPDGTNNYSSAADPHDSGYENYENYKNEERFDHIGVTLNGNVKKHEAIYYINQLDPTELKDGTYVNLRNRYYHTDKDTTSANASTSATCATRFADKGVDNRLFTCWVDFDGTNMKVSYANGAMSVAKKPATAQISEKVDLSQFEGKTVYVGFTSAIGSSKANHTIHSFQITVPTEEVVENANYALRYWLKDKNTGEYVLKDTSDTTTDVVGTTVTAEKVDGNYAAKYDSEGYTYSKSAKQVTSTTLEKAGNTYYMDVYYDPAEAYYKLNYHVWDADKNEYVKKDTTTAATGYVGDSYTVTDVDASYNTKYPGYTVNADKKDTYKVTLDKAGETYEMDVYYDPEQAGYKLNYYKRNPNTGEYEYVECTKTVEGEIGKTYTVTDADADYENKYKKDQYTLNKDKNETYSVTVEDADVVYEMNVYYDPVLTTYKTEYYLQQPDGSYKLKDTVQGEKTYAGKDVTAPEKTYDGYTHVLISDSLEADKVAADGSTTLKVYYNYKEAPTYAVQYYVEQPDGSYKLYTETTSIPGVTGETANADIIKIDGYTHTTTDNSKESGVIAADSSTVLKVYYNLSENKLPGMDIETVTPTPTLEVTAEPEVTEEPEEVVEPEEPEELEEPEEPKENVKTKQKKTSAPKTGDHSNPIVFIVLMLMSCAAAIDAAVRAAKL